MSLDNDSKNSAATDSESRALPLFWSLTLDELHAELPAEEVELLRASLTAVGPALHQSPEFNAVDAVVRQVTPLGLLAQGFAPAAEELRALGRVSSFESARATMIAIERVARRYNAPSVLMRAAGGAPSTLLLQERHANADEEKRAWARMQVCVAVARVVGLVLRTGAACHPVAQALLTP